MATLQANDNRNDILYLTCFFEEQEKQERCFDDNDDLMVSYVWLKWNNNCAPQ